MSGNTWVPVAGAKQTLASTIVNTMVDNGNGSYSYTYSVLLDGAVTVLIQLVTTGNVFGEYYPNNSWSGSVSKANYTSKLDMDWGAGDIIPGDNDNVSAYFFTWLKPPTTETYIDKNKLKMSI